MSYGSFTFGGIHVQRTRTVFTVNGVTIFDDEITPSQPVIASLEIIAKDSNGKIISIPASNFKQVQIQITGNVNELKLQSGEVTINGYCNSIKSESSNITVAGAVQDATTSTGNIKAHYVTKSAVSFVGNISGIGGTPPKEAETAVNAAKAITAVVEETIKKREKRKKQQETTFEPDPPPLPKSRVTIEEIPYDKTTKKKPEKRKQRPDQEYVASLD